VLSYDPSFHCAAFGSRVIMGPLSLPRRFGRFQHTDNGCLYPVEVTLRLMTAFIEVAS
jgi:hypothetical protein